MIVLVASCSSLEVRAPAVDEHDREEILGCAGYGAERCAGDVMVSESISIPCPVLYSQEDLANLSITFVESPLPTRIATVVNTEISPPSKRVVSISDKGCVDITELPAFNEAVSLMDLRVSSDTSCAHATFFYDQLRCMPSDCLVSCKLVSLSEQESLVAVEYKSFPSGTATAMIIVRLDGTISFL
jgi:hypothetical protein